MAKTESSPCPFQSFTLLLFQFSNMALPISQHGCPTLIFKWWIEATILVTFKMAALIQPYRKPFINSAPVPATEEYKECKHPCPDNLK